MVQSIQCPNPKKSKGEKTRNLQLIEGFPCDLELIASWLAVVAFGLPRRPRSPRPPLLRLHLLGCSPLLQRGLRVCTGPGHPHEGEVIGYVLDVLLLHGPYHGGTANGARAPGSLPLHNLLDGRAQNRALCFCSHVGHRARVRARVSGARPRHRGRDHGCQASLSYGDHYNAGFCLGWRLLCAQIVTLWLLDEVCFHHFLLLSAACLCPIRRRGEHLVAARVLVPGAGCRAGPGTRRRRL